MRSILRAQLARLASMSLLPAILCGCASSGLVVSGGCSGVRQDRTITFSADGTQVAVQHDRDGIFVADPDTGDISKIFDPPRDIVAASSPLWSPQDKRLIFATAVALDDGSVVTQANDDPDGRWARAGRVEYTCWLRPTPDADGTAKPQPLFKARCGHEGYVAANLALRWCPDGNGILYVKQNDKGSHQLFKFDLQTGESKRVFPHSAQALVFDWSPDNAHLACVLVGDDAAKTGIWVGTPGTESWWRIPGSELKGDLESARAARPIWSRDGKSLAFTRFVPNNSRDSGQSSLTVVKFGERQRLKLVQDTEPLTDLHWSPDGTQLAFVRGGDKPSLQIIDMTGKRTKEIPDVRHFAGWNHAGDKLAYVVPEKQSASESTQCILLLPVANSRDKVVIQSLNGDSSTVFSGMHVSFPAWSPKDDKLTVWFTFEPTHHSLFESIYDMGLHRGDPAAVLDTTSGDIRWFAVNDFENAQVGHFCLLKGKTEEAWKWYQRAKDAPKRERAGRPDFLRELYAGRDYRFFEAVCLRRLGRAEEANEKLAQFNVGWDNAMKQAGGDNARSSLLTAVSPLGRQFLRQFYVADVFISLDAIDEGCEYFRFALREAHDDDERYAIQFVLAQMLLMGGSNDEYARLAAQKLWPMLLNRRGSELLPSGDDIMVCCEGLVLTPLLTTEFVNTLSPEIIQEILPSVIEYRSTSRNDTQCLFSDLFLHAAYGALHEPEKQLMVRSSLELNPLFEGFQPEDMKTRQEKLRELSDELEKLKQSLQRLGLTGG